MSASIPSDFESANMSQCKETGEADEGVDMSCERVNTEVIAVNTESSATEGEFSNNAAVELHESKHDDEFEANPDIVNNKIEQSEEMNLDSEMKGEVNMAYENDEGTLDRSRSDEHLEIKHQWQTRELVDNLKDSPSAVSDVNNGEYIAMKNFEEHGTPEAFAESSCTESPGITSQDGMQYDDEEDEDYYIETAGDERMSLIEEEYIDRITLLERRNCDLEMVLHRLTCSVERLLCLNEGEMNQLAGIRTRANKDKAPANTETENEVTEGDKQEAAEGDRQEVAEGDKQEVAEGDKQEETEADKQEVAESDKQEETEGDKLEETEGDKLEETEGDKLEETEGDKQVSPTKVTVRNEESQEESPEAKDETDAVPANAEEAAVLEENPNCTTKCVARHICIELFIEFQKKLAMFAGELKGVLNCSESAIRHGRVVQEWGKSIQLMFEQLLHERKKLMCFIEDREQVMLQSREQFIAEKQEQGRQLQHIIEEMKKYKQLMDDVEYSCRDKVIESSHRQTLADSVVELLLQRRLEEERAIILGLTRQSKISEMKLFIMHQQNCIQDLQIQNKELRAVIEGLVGPEDLVDDEEVTYETDRSDTPDMLPGSVVLPDGTKVDENSVDALEISTSAPISMISDVLYCDRGQYLPGMSTDGDLATVQAYEIGAGSDRVDPGKPIVFDPLSVDYVREYCQQAEETERRAMQENQEKVEEQESVAEVSAIKDGVQSLIIEPCASMEHGVQALNIEPFMRKQAEQEKMLAKLVNKQEQDAGGDGIDVKTAATTADKVEPPQPTVNGEHIVEAN